MRQISPSVFTLQKHAPGWKDHSISPSGLAFHGRLVLVQLPSTWIIHAHHWIIPASPALCDLTHPPRALPNAISQAVFSSELSSLGTFRTPRLWWFWVQRGWEGGRPLPPLLSATDKAFIVWTRNCKLVVWRPNLASSIFCLSHGKSWISYQH